MDHQSYKEVHFHKYCKTCKLEKASETDHPCDECMGETINLNSHKPVHYEKKETKR